MSRRSLLVTAAGVATALVLVAALTSQASGLAVATDPVAEAAVQQMTQPLNAVALPALPGEPVEALVHAVNAEAASLGFDRDYGPAIRAAQIPPEYAGRVALLVQAALACPATTQIECAVETNRAAAGVARTKVPAFKDVDAWPVLAIDGNGGGNLYPYDYVVQVDRGGEDTPHHKTGGHLLYPTPGPGRPP